MLNRLPRQLPPLSLMLSDLGNPSHDDLARALGVTARTVRRWVADDDAPRPALLALYWLTRWGQSAVDAEAYNAMRMHAGLADARGREIERLRAELARLAALADYGSANAPTLAVLPMAQVLPFRAAGPRPPWRR